MSGDRRRRWRRGTARKAIPWVLGAAAAVAVASAAMPALAQVELPPVNLPEPSAPPAAAPAAPTPPEGPRIDPNAPVTFTADQVEYDSQRGVVTARGRVEAWQGERFLRADEFTYDRNTGVATARGNVSLLEPDGQVVFADEVELKDQFKEGVLEGVSALLASNARVVATGARRTGGIVNELARVVYSACDLCPEDPTRPPLWQVQARRAIQDKESQRITYRDAQVRFFGIPVFFTPYLSHPDPSAPRASGFLFPTLGITRFLGPFAEIPYYWAIDQTQDLTIAPVLSTRQYPNLGLEYRKRFNFGEVSANASVGYFGDNDTQGEEGLAGHIFARGRFALDENWRAGVDLNRASSELYLRTFRYEYRRVLTSQAFVEGFWGTERYARLDSRVYQSLRDTDDTAQVPFVLPNLYFEQAPRQRVLGGYMTVDAGMLGIYRTIGSQSQRLATRVRWERPEIGPIGDVWTFRLQGDAIGYNAAGQQEPPTNLPNANGTNAVGNIRFGVDWRLPLVRSAGEWGQQLIEPRVQLVTGPATGTQSDIPNEDSVDFEFTDANLFELNRFTGRDRQEGGSRVDAAIRAAWNFPNGGQVESLVGRSFAFSDTRWNPYPESGLQNRGSDYVARARVAPVPWFDVTGRVRTDGQQPLVLTFSDAVATLSLGPVGLSAGYFSTPAYPYLTPVQARREVGFGAFARIGEHWRVGVSGKYSLELGELSVLQAAAGYEDECFILESRFMKRFAVNPATDTQYPSNTIVLFRIAFKTLGAYSFRAI
jgi:LPS-assembly protein